MTRKLSTYSRDVEFCIQLDGFLYDSVNIRVAHFGPRAVYREIMVQLYSAYGYPCLAYTRKASVAYSYVYRKMTQLFLRIEL